MDFDPNLAADLNPSSSTAADPNPSPQPNAVDRGDEDLALPAPDVSPSSFADAAGDPDDDATTAADVEPAEDGVLKSADPAVAIGRTEVVDLELEQADLSSEDGIAAESADSAQAERPGSPELVESESDVFVDVAAEDGSIELENLDVAATSHVDAATDGQAELGNHEVETTSYIDAAADAPAELENHVRGGTSLVAAVADGSIELENHDLAASSSVSVAASTVGPIILEDRDDVATSSATFAIAADEELLPSTNDEGSVLAEIEVEDQLTRTSNLGDRLLSGGGESGAQSETEINGGSRPASPHSSGYDPGSSMVSMSSLIEPVDEGRILVDDIASEKKHLNEDDTSEMWRKRKKHFLILSHSGKPIYSRYGDEHRLASFSATLQAIIANFEDRGDQINHVRVGKHEIVFLVRKPVYLVCISCTEEPRRIIRAQLELMYGQMVLILTKSVSHYFEKSPNFDMSPLLGGTNAVFFSLIHSFNWNPATFLHAYTCLPLPHAKREAVSAVLEDVTESGILFALLMCKQKVISLAKAQKASLHPDDILLLSNFVLSSESFRTAESFLPICLPRYNPTAFLYVYVHFLDVNTYLALLTTNPDDFYHLKSCREKIQGKLMESNVLNEAWKSMVDGNLHVEDLPADSSQAARSISEQFGRQSGNSVATSLVTATSGPAGLWHFIYKFTSLKQYVSSEYALPIRNPKQQKRLFRAYQKIYASMHDKESGPHKMKFRRDENYVNLCWITEDFELYATFDPLADKAQAIRVCNRVCHWIRALENEIFDGSSVAW